ncbi:MAG: hypothetical protein ACE5IR_03730 [bacterium]
MFVVFIVTGTVFFDPNALAYDTAALDIQEFRSDKTFEIILIFLIIIISFMLMPFALLVAGWQLFQNGHPDWGILTILIGLHYVLKMFGIRKPTRW